MGKGWNTFKSTSTYDTPKLDQASWEGLIKVCFLGAYQTLREACSQIRCHYENITSTSDSNCKLQHKKISISLGHPSGDTLHLPPHSNWIKKIPHSQLWLQKQEILTQHNTPLLRVIVVHIIHYVRSTLSQDISWLEVKPLVDSHLLYWLQTALWLFLWLKWHWSAWWQTQWNRHCSSPAIRKANVNKSWF